jgi:hypothetical protein
MLPMLYVISLGGKVFYAEFGCRNNVRVELTEMIEKQLKGTAK